METRVETRCEKRIKRIGISKSVLLKITFLRRIIFENHRKPMEIAIPKVSHILLNSKSSEVFPAKTRGIRRKRE